MTKLTSARQRALAWLPADGTWKTNPGRLSVALNSLSLGWPGCVEAQWGPFGPRGGNEQRWRLTPKGVENARQYLPTKPE